MKLTPWFIIGFYGTPQRSGRYEFEIYLQDTVVTLMASHRAGENYVITDDARIITLTYEDCWRGVLK